MNAIKNFIKKRWGRIGIFIIGICTFFGAERGCCPFCEKPKDIAVIYVVDNDHIYYTYSNDTLFVRFWYHMEESLQDSFKYAVIYFYGIRAGREYPHPSSAFYIKSNDTIILNKESFPINPEGRWDTLFFKDYAPVDSYDIYVWLECWKQYPGREGGAPIVQEKGEEPTNVYGPGGRQLILYMGNQRICNCGDTLGDTLKDPYAYPLYLQVVDSAGNGINGDTLWFKTDYGIFEGGYNELLTITDTFRYIANEELLSGVSRQPWFIFPNEPHDIVITVEAMKGTNIWATKQVRLKCFRDTELSGLNPPKCHETTDSIKNVEIPGDGYNDGEGKKTIKVEIDYDADIVNQGLVVDFIAVTKKILATARIDTSAANFVISDGFSGPDVLDKLTVKSLLASYRDYSDHIHLIIGSKRANYTGFGEVISYVDTTWGNFSHTKCAHLASTDSAIAKAYLDSTGIFIYGQQIEDAMEAVNWDTLYYYHWIPIDNTYGICMAHEIGHALGISSHDSLRGVMRHINFKKNAYDWMYFVDTLLNKHPPYDAVNTRDVLGIHTIDIGW